MSATPSAPSALRPRRRGLDVCSPELAMPPHDLALWDISLMNRSLLSAASYAQMFKPVLLRMVSVAVTDWEFPGQERWPRLH